LSEREIACDDLTLAIEGLQRDGYRIEVIYPADDPHTAILGRNGESVRLTSRPDAPAPSAGLPPFAPEFVLNRAADGFGQGRAGMLYRDLIPGRLGGRYIASHITIPAGGPVADWVHFHRIAFQLICVRRGWVRLVYEGQGEPFVMEPGDMVLQPPEIRHRVLESSPGLEVIEIGCPALHETLADHDLELPNGLDPDRRFRGQRFARHRSSEASWSVFGAAMAQETKIGEATGDLAEVRTVRLRPSSHVAFPPHDGELVFGFLLTGSASLDYCGTAVLGPGDAFVIPPKEAWGLSGASDDMRLLHVTTAVLG
jgi:quercetin dioxygenase-like cupin family protein